MGRIYSDEKLVKGTSDNDGFWIFDQTDQVTVFGYGGNDWIVQPSLLNPDANGNFKVNYYFDGGSGIDGVQLGWVKQFVSLTFTATRKVINAKGQMGIELKIDGPATGSNWDYHAILINCERLEYFSRDTYYDLLDPYFRILGITASKQIFLAETEAIDSDQIVLRTIYDNGGTYTFGSASDVIDFQYYTIIANLGGGDDMIRLEGGYSSATLDGGSGKDIIVLLPYNNAAILAHQAVYHDLGNGFLYLDVPDAGTSKVTFTNFEYIVFDNITVQIVEGRTGADKLRGTAANYNVIAGHEGNDTLTGVTAGDTLLGGDGNDLLIAGAGASNRRNMLVNGGFEINSAATGSTIRSASLKGWTSLVQQDGVWTTGGEIKVWKAPRTPTATEGRSYLELDANTQVNGIAQSVQTEAGKTYKLTFDLAARQKDVSDTVNVFWGGTKVGTFSNVKNEWTSFAVLVYGTGAKASLQFSEANGQNDGSGVLLDNITLAAFNPTELETMNVLQGGKGRDTMVGSVAADRFVFGSADESGATAETADVIRGFTTGVDLVDISAIPTAEYISWPTGNKFTNHWDELITTSAKVGKETGLLVSLDIDGDAKADFAIFFANVTSLSAKDFVITR